MDIRLGNISDNSCVERVVTELCPLCYKQIIHFGGRENLITSENDFLVPLKELSDNTYIKISYWQNFELLVHGYEINVTRYALCKK